jgi:hypothetical protein
MAKKQKTWIQKAIKNPGALRKKLGVPEDENIPAEKLQPKPGDSTETRRQKALARTLRKLNRKRKE